LAKGIDEGIVFVYVRYTKISREIQETVAKERAGRPQSTKTLVAKETAYARLKEEIVSAGLRPGSPLPEREVAERYQLSRTPVREIIQRLHYDGLVDLIPNRGAFVRHFSAEQIVDIFYAREAVETMAARLAAVRHRSDDLQHIERLFSGVRVENSPQALRRLVEAGQRLHDFIIESARNGHLSKTYESLKSQARLIRAITQQMFDVEEASYHDSLRVLDAIRRRDAVAAEQAMRHHLISTREKVMSKMFRDA
jgi:DNA-binding GntR family transcriptional regulator